VLFQIESVRLLLYPPIDKVTLCFDMSGASRYSFFFEPVFRQANA
jgi:hypothetical protein